MKKLITLFLMACGPVAAATYTPVSPIITPDVATGHRSYSSSTLSLDGDILVCPTRDWYYSSDKLCKDPGGNNRWTKLKDAVPKGKTYAGYSISPSGETIFVYWK